MTTASFAMKAISKGPIAADFTIPIVLTLVTLSLFTTRISHCLLHPQVFNSSNDFKILPHISQQSRIPCTHSRTNLPDLKHPFPLARCFPRATTSPKQFA